MFLIIQDIKFFIFLINVKHPKERKSNFRNPIRCLKKRKRAFQVDLFSEVLELRLTFAILKPCLISFLITQMMKGE